MNCLVIDACARIDSRTRKFGNEFLRKNQFKNINVINLYNLNLFPIDEDRIKERDYLINNKIFNDDTFYLANQFSKADIIVILAPYWDLSFPSILKVYFENISVSGITFDYIDGNLKGLCKANELIYLSTCGGYVNKNLGYEYVKELANMFGINNTKYYQIDGLDIDPSKSNEILEKRIKEEVLK